MATDMINDHSLNHSLIQSRAYFNNFLLVQVKPQKCIDHKRQQFITLYVTNGIHDFVKRCIKSWVHLDLQPNKMISINDVQERLLGHAVSESSRRISPRCYLLDYNIYGLSFPIILNYYLMCIFRASCYRERLSSAKSQA